MSPKTNPRILVVEDDSADADPIREQLQARFGARVDVISTEREFVDKFEEIATRPPDVIVMDVMLRWTRPSPDLTEESIPARVREEGFYFAGLRCIDMLEQDSRTRKIPYVIYSGLDQNNFTKRVIHTKSDDLNRLVEEIAKVSDLARLPPTT
jgi:CheY-like chemotaxis protein